MPNTEIRDVKRAQLGDPVRLSRLDASDNFWDQVNQLTRECLANPPMNNGKGLARRRRISG